MRGRWGPVMMVGLVAAIVVGAAALAFGVARLLRGDDLPLETANKVTRNWGRIVLTCSDPDQVPTAADLSAANRSLAVLISQYARTPNGRVQLVESSDKDSMRRVLGIVATRDRGDPASCEPIRQGAQAALDYQP